MSSVTIDARLYRPRGSEEGERDNLAILLTCVTFLLFTGIDTSAKWLIGRFSKGTEGV